MQGGREGAMGAVLEEGGDEEGVISSPMLGGEVV